MTTVAQLTIEMAANVARLRTDMDAARRTVDGAMGHIGKSAQTATRLLGGIGGALAVQQLARQYLQFADAVTVVENKLRLAHTSVYAQKRAYDELFVIAQRSRVSFTELSHTYSSIARNGGPQSQVLKVTEAISNAMTVSGGAAEGMKAALVQLGQGMASGVLRGEELNSVMEQTPRLARAIADGMGITLGQLRQYGAAGLLTTEAVTRALISQADVLKNEVATATMTVAQANTVLDNSATNLVGSIDKATNASGFWAGTVKALSNDLDAMGAAIDRTAKSGYGGFMQMGNALTVLGGRSVLGFVQGGFNMFNGAVNAVTGNVLGLKENIDLMPEAFKAFGDEQASVNRKLVDARAYYDKLAERLGKAPENIYIKSELHQLGLYIGKLQQAKAEQDKLSGASNPASYSNEDRREAARQGDLKAAAAREQARADLLKKYASPVEKMNRELQEQREKLGALFTPELEARIRANFEKPTRGAGAAASATVDEFKKLADALKGDITAGAAAAEAAQRGYNSAQAGFLELAASPEWAKLTTDQRAQVAVLYEQKIAQEQATDVRKLATEAVTEAVKVNAELVKQYANAAASAQQRLTDLEHEAEAVAYAERNQIGLAQAVELTTIARLKEQQVGAMGNEAIVLQLQAEIEAHEKIVGMLNSTDVRDAGRELRKNEAAEWARTWDQVGQSFTDALMQGGKSVSEYLKDLFRTLVLRPILAPVGGVVSSLLGGAASAGQGASAASSASGLLGGLGQVSALASAFGTGMAASFTSMVSAGVSGWATAAGSLIGSGSAAGIAAGLGMVAAPLAAAALLWKPLFGRKLKDSGITGEFGGDAGFSGSQYQFFKGGLFRSDKTSTTGMDGELRAALVSQYNLLKDNTTGLAGQLKLSAAALETYNRKIKFSTKGLTEDQIVARLNEEFGAMGEEMAALVLGTTAYTREGEAASATLVRLSTSLTGANALLGVVGQTLFDVGLVGADMASQLADKFGGLDAMAQATAAYYQTYYTASERADAATAALTAGLGTLGLSLPNTNAGFRALVDGLDLTTEHGRTTYATLLQMAPEFAALQVELQRLADETAAQLIAAFTGRGQLLPALGSMADAIAATTAQALVFAGPVSTINRLLGDAASGVLVFGDQLDTTTSALTPAQAAVAALHGEVFALRTAASGTVVDVAGLAEALEGVDTRAFVATVVGVFDLIGQRIQETLASIADERTALREAAMAIIAPGGMSVAQIRSQITASMVGLPSSAGVARTQTALATADARVATREAAVYNAQGAILALAASQRDAIAKAQASITNIVDVEWYKLARPDVVNSVLGRDGKYQDHFDRFGIFEGGSANLSDRNARTTIRRLTEQLEAGTPAALATRLTAAQTALSTELANQAAAVEAAKTAQLSYVDALQKYSLDSSKAVANLGRLREETVRYYESQRQLAELMTGTASGLRATVAQFRFDQLDPAAQLASLQDRYNVAYSMALSTTGETLAGYGAELNGLINPLLAKAQEAGLTGIEYSNLVSTVLARAEAAATRLEANAPQNYQAESLGLLGQIDSTLAALEAGALTADQLIVNAINAGRDSTRDGLRAVVAALTGQTIPAFALGGMHAGGVRLVGENGPELEVTGPSRIYSAGQTRAMLGGNSSEAVVAELRALRQEVAALRRENATLQTQTVVNTGKTARQLDRWDVEGLAVRNTEGETLTVETA